MVNKRKRSQPDWSKLHTDLLESILKRLSFIDILRFKAVCCSWLSVVEAYISSPSRTRFLQTPWLINDASFFNLEEKRVYKFKGVPKELGEIGCVGASHGWLVYLDERAAPYLMNPFSQAPRIQLPPITDICTCVDGEFIIEFKTGNNDSLSLCFESLTELREKLVAKAVLSSDPFHSSNCRVAVMYCFTSKLAFCNFGDGAWTDLNGKHESYSDIIFYNQDLYALCDDGSIEVWDLGKSFPVKKMEIETYPSNGVTQSLKAAFLSDFYLVESSLDLLLVRRFLKVGAIVIGRGNHHQVSRKTTFLFQVFKLDFNMRKWVLVESLGDRVLFLGRNHSLSLSAQHVPECEENSIYFNDDYCNTLKVSQGMGVYNLEDKIIKPIYHCDSRRMKPPIWVVPNPWCGRIDNRF